ncbi:MAG: cadherin domain-containing protein [Aphanizomenon sp.]
MNILNSVLPITYNQLIDFANKNNFWQVFDTAFGTQYNRSLAEILRLQWETGDFSQLPQIEVLDSSILGSANGAYASSENRIYLSNTFVASASLAAISGVLLEEIGHFVDAKINQTDSAGDEGAIFAALVQGQNLDVETLRILKAEDDHSIITLNNQQIDIEQANTTLSFPGVSDGSVTWADYNGDGKQEFLFTGITDISKLYKNTGNGFEEDINANQSDTNQAPTNITLNNSTIAENQPINTKIGNFTTIDPNTANTFTYSLVSGTGDTNNNSFIIVGNNELQTKAVFDYETKNSYSIRIKTTDQGGLSFEKQLTIGVTDVNDRTLTPITDYAPNVNISTGLIFSTNGGGNLSLDTNRLSASNEVTGVQNGTKSNFNHLFGLYEVVDAEGGINTEKGVLKPGDSDYARYALTTARVKDFIVQAGSSDTPSTATQLGSGVSLQGNKFYAPFVIANCGTYFPNLQQGVEDFIAAENGDVNRFANALQYVRDLVATEAGNEFNNAPRFVQEPVAYFSFGSANPDKSPHLRSYGNGVYGFEDLPATATQYSNNDFNDAVFALS